jgi:WD40 repeat protein
MICYRGSCLPMRCCQVSASGGLNALDIANDGRHFITGGGDKLLKVLTYSEGDVTHVGQGHRYEQTCVECLYNQQYSRLRDSGDVTAAAICPNQQYIVSVTASGSIFRWEYPNAQPLSM